SARAACCFSAERNLGSAGRQPKKNQGKRCTRIAAAPFFAAADVHRAAMNLEPKPYYTSAAVCPQVVVEFPGHAQPRDKGQTMPEQQFASYEDFFTFYLHEHSDARNRAMHAAGTLLGLVTLVVAFAVRHPWYALLWPVVSYAFAWTGHFLLEGNKPATFGHP